MVIALCSCQASISNIKSKLSPSEQLLVGKWVSNGDGGRREITRYSDKTYIEKADVRFDTNAPPAHCTSRGTWEVNKGFYVERVIEVDNPRFRAWVSKKWSFGILGNIQPDAFEYMGDDTPVIIEKRIRTFPRS
jgi:hypothetical protein